MQFAFLPEQRVTVNVSSPARIMHLTSVRHIGYINIISCGQLQSCSSDQTRVATSHALDMADALWKAGKPGSLSRGKRLLSVSCLHSQQPTSTLIWMSSKWHVEYAPFLDALDAVLSNSCIHTAAYTALSLGFYLLNLT